MNKAYVMNTFFYTMLENMQANQNYNYSKLERIIKKLKIQNLSAFKLTLIPVNIRHSHWLLIAIDPSQALIQVLDSMGPASTDECLRYLQVLHPFLIDHFSVNPWNISPMDVPLQGNGYDCGLCTSLTLEMISQTGITKSLSYPVLEDGITITKQYLNEARQRLSVELMLGHIIVE